jgi:hypothetical protein
MRLCPLCDQLKNCSRRFRGRRVCFTCYKKARYPAASCPLCLNERPLVNIVDGIRACDSCAIKHRKKKSTGTCVDCGREAYLVKRRCHTHYSRLWERTRPAGTCKTCRKVKPLPPCRQCFTCAKRIRDDRAIRRALNDLLKLDDKVARQDIAELGRYLMQRDRRRKVPKWLRTLDGAIVDYLRRVADGAPIEAEHLELIQPLPGGAFLVDSCYRAGIVQGIPINFERIERYLSSIEDSSRDVALLVRQYWQFHLKPSVYLRPYRNVHMDLQLWNDLRQLRIANEFLCDVSGFGIAIPDLTQDVVDHWCMGKSEATRERLRRCVTFLCTQGIVRRTLSVPRLRPASRVKLSTQELLAVLSCALNDSSLPLRARAGLICIVLACRRPAEIVRVRTSNVKALDRDATEVQFPKGIAYRFEGEASRVIRKLVASGSLWLFNRHRSTERMRAVELGRIIHRAGFGVNLARLYDAAVDSNLSTMEPGELVRALGLHSSTASQWRGRHVDLDPFMKQQVAIPRTSAGERVGA